MRYCTIPQSPALPTHVIHAARLEIEIDFDFGFLWEIDSKLEL